MYKYTYLTFLSFNNKMNILIIDTSWSNFLQLLNVPSTNVVFI